MEGKESINFFAKTNFNGRETVFGVKERDRKSHMHFIGKDGSGKTELLLNMVAQDMRSGKGVFILDSQGDLAQKSLLAIPRERAEEVIYFNLADSDFPVAFNFFEKINSDSRLVATDQLLDIFKELIGEQWNQRMYYLLKNIFLALMEYPSATFLGLGRLLTDNDYRQKVIDAIHNTEVRQFWLEEFNKYYSQIFNQAIIPLQKIIIPILNHATLKNIIGQSTSRLKLEEALASQQIVILDLSSQKCNEKIRHLLGGLFLAKVQLASLENDNKKYNSHIYIDEAQSFIGNNFPCFLRDLNRREIGVVSANQFVFQINPELWQDILKNIGTVGFFQLSENDVNFFEKECGLLFPGQYSEETKPFHLFLKLVIDGKASSPFMAETLPPLVFFERDLQRANAIVDLSRKKFSQTREKVEIKINQWLGNRKKILRKIKEIAKEQFGVSNKHKKKAVSFFNFLEPMEVRTFKINCIACGTKTEVPFLPDGKNPVFCKNCLREYRKAQSQLEKREQEKKQKISKEEARFIKRIKRSGWYHNKGKLPVRKKKVIDYAGLKKMIATAMEEK